MFTPPPSPKTVGSILPNATPVFFHPLPLKTFSPTAGGPDSFDLYLIEENRQEITPPPASPSPASLPTGFPPTETWTWSPTGSPTSAVDASDSYSYAFDSYSYVYESDPYYDDLFFFNGASPRG